MLAGFAYTAPRRNHCKEELSMTEGMDLSTMTSMRNMTHGNVLNCSIQMIVSQLEIE